MDAELTSSFFLYASEPMFAAFSICACHPWSCRKWPCYSSLYRSNCYGNECTGLVWPTHLHPALVSVHLKAHHIFSFGFCLCTYEFSSCCWPPQSPLISRSCGYLNAPSLSGCMFWFSSTRYRERWERVRFDPAYVWTAKPSKLTNAKLGKVQCSRTLSFSARDFEGPRLCSSGPIQLSDQLTHHKTA